MALVALRTFHFCKFPGVQRHSQHQRARQQLAKRVGARTCELRDLQGCAQESVPVLPCKPRSSQVLTPARHAWQAAAWLGDSFEHNVHKPSDSFGPVSRNFWGRGVATFNRLQASESAELLKFAGHSLPSADQDSPSMTVSLVPPLQR